MLNLDLAEVMSVSQANPTPGAPKKTDDKSFFDVSYYLFLFSNEMYLVVTMFFSCFSIFSCVQTEELTIFLLVI